MLSDRSNRYSGIVKTIGPGILFAGAAIGGSHLVQSTKAGAIYGFDLVLIVILANLFKYPFFEFCHRYTAATGESALEGYRRLGKPALLIFLIIAVVSAFINIAAVTAVTAALAGQMFGASLSIFWWSAIVSGVCIVLLFAGRYPGLDAAIKIILAVLAVSAIAAFFAAAVHGSNAAPDAQSPPIWDMAGIAFLLALMGWMPGPIDIAVWPSLWALKRRDQTGHRPSLRETLIDFHLGYVGSAILALAFLGLGALVMFGTGETPEQKGIPFANQLISMFTHTLGQWSYYLIAAAALTCMFSTSLTCFDGYSRSISNAWHILSDRQGCASADRMNRALMIVFLLSNLLVVGFLMRTMGNLVNIATITAFLTAPVIAFINFRMIESRHIPVAARIPVWLRILAYLGLAFLTGFAVLFVLSRFLL